MSQAERRLAAIMFTDMVGYTSLSQKDEALAFRLLEEHRRVVRPILAKHNGTEVKTVGDAFLIDFPSALEAVTCAIDIQRSLQALNSGRSADTMLVIRIGIHLGDVIHVENDVYGDAVNIASRIEQTAKPGAICVSEQVYQSVLNKGPYRFESLGRVEMRNVRYPIAVYSVYEAAATGAWTPSPSSERETERDGHPPRERVAVLPFVNISPEGEDEYFADGMTEELISALSSIDGLRVIARTSVMNYKRTLKNVSEISRELGAGSIVEGSVRKAGKRIRVAVQLVEATTQEHLWNSNYDKDLDDIFAVQTEIATKVAEAISGRIIRGPTAPTRVVSLPAYELFLQGRELLHDRTETSLKKALDLFERAVRLEPGFAGAYVGIANTYAEMAVMNVVPISAMNDARIAVEKAIALDDNLADAHATYSFLLWILDDIEGAEREARRGVELNPSLASAYESLATLLATTGHLEAGVKNQEMAYELDPLSARIASYLGEFLLYSGRGGEALDHWRRMLARQPFYAYQGFALERICRGDYQGAQEYVEKMDELDPRNRSAYLMRGMVAGFLGKRKEAQGVIRNIESDFPAGPLNVTLIGFIKFALGDVDEFFDCMIKAAETHVLWPIQLRYAPQFASVRGDPRMKEAFGKAGVDF